MVSQHPDHARVPYWKNSAFISTKREAEECYRAFSELGADEFLWDWEGKLVDEAIVERLLQNYFDFFKKNQLGKDIFLTFRLPNLDAKMDYRIGRALFAMRTAQSLSQAAKLNTPPLIEVILPLVKSADDLLKINDGYSQLRNLDHTLFKLPQDSPDQIGVIPLFEEIDTLFNVKEILKEYLSEYKRRYGSLPEYMRPFSARSDPALNAGIVPAVIANKVALELYHQTEKETGVAMHPIIGPGALPFRGHFSPDNLANFLKEYQGVHTFVIQGAFRYDWDQQSVKRAIQEISMSKTVPPKATINLEEASTLCQIFRAPYQATVEKLAKEINHIAAQIPSRRERMLHVGLFGYSRGIGKVSLPRAIKFTAALYSMGAPPEIIGTGRGLKQAAKQKLLGSLEKYYQNLRSDLQQAMMYYNEAAVKKLAKKNPAWKDVLKDAQIIKEFLKSEGPRTIHQEHSKVTNKIVSNLGKSVPEEETRQHLEQAALLRQSIG